VSTWTIERVVGPADVLHARDGWESDVPVVRLLEVTTPALVLGSTQPAADVDPDAARALGVDVVRRSSGGGAVLLVPGEHVWIDVVLPRHDDAWTDDVSHAARWLGRRWAEALAPRDVTVHEGRLEGGDLGRTVCFAGRGPGEVFVGDAKVVGVSQARRRDAARFQALVHGVVRPDDYVRLLAPALGTIGAVPAARAIAAGVATLEEAGDPLGLAERLSDALRSS